MSEDSIKTAEEQLHALINESNLVLTKMKTESGVIFTKLRRIINILITVGIGIFITFLYSFVDVRSRMATLESEKASKVEVMEQLEKYSLKTDVIFLQNNLFDINKMFYAPGKYYDEARMEAKYSSALKQFNSDVSRGAK